MVHQRFLLETTNHSNTSIVLLNNKQIFQLSVRLNAKRQGASHSDVGRS